METTGAEGVPGASGKSCKGSCGKKGVAVVGLLLVGLTIGAVACGGKHACGAKTAVPIATGTPAAEAPAVPTEAAP